MISSFIFFCILVLWSLHVFCCHCITCYILVKINKCYALGTPEIPKSILLPINSHIREIYNSSCTVYKTKCKKSTSNNDNLYEVSLDS